MECHPGGDEPASWGPGGIDPRYVLKIKKAS